MKALLIFVAIAAVLVAGAVLFFNPNSDTIEYQGYRIPTSELRIADPHPGCDYPHYHAATGESVTTTDGSPFADTNDCGFGPVQ